MKSLLVLTFAVVALSSAQAQVFRPGAGRGGRHGGSHDRGVVQVVSRGAPHGAYVYRHAPVVYGGYRPAVFGGYGYYRGYGVDYPYYGTIGYGGTGSASASGFWLGALAGGIIGNNSGSFGHSGWRGAAWGAGLGWLLGSVADANRRVISYEAAPFGVTSPASVQAAVPTQAPQQVTIINNYYNSSSPMSGANSLFGR